MRFETLIDQYHDEIYAYLWRLLATSPDPAVEAQDLVQEVFLRAYRAYSRLPASSNYRAWLYKIATNCANTALRRGQHMARNAHDSPGEAFPDLPDSAPTPHDLVTGAETLDGVRAAIDDLPFKQRTALVMRYVQGVDYDGIAEALGCSSESARANVYQAVRQLRRRLAGHR
jgi:RNA polymerase sigma-70 factor (ECF subfamily)